MKALKVTVSIIIAVAICAAIYMIFFSHPGEVQAIMEKHKKEKSNFESKIKEYEVKEAELQGKIKSKDEKIEKTTRDYEETVVALEKLKNDYKKSARPVDPATITDLEKCRGLYSELAKTLDESEGLTAETQKALDGCNQLRLFQEEQIINLKSAVSLKADKINTQAAEINRLNITVNDLYKAKKPKLWKYIAAFIAGGVIVAISK